MFTGIIEHIGFVKVMRKKGINSQIVFNTPTVSINSAGSSVAVNGVCLTAQNVHNDVHTWEAHIMDETMKKTTFPNLRVNERVNIELPITSVQPLSGHFVQGHIDGIALIRVIVPSGSDNILTFEPPEHLIPYLVSKGSVALDGVSLTVIDVVNQTFSVSLFPYTVQHTTFQDKHVGDYVNIEVDVIAKYVQSFVNAYQPNLLKSSS